MVAPLAALPAGAFVSGQAVFHGRELLAELPLVSELPFSRVGPVLGHGADWACHSPGVSILGAVGVKVSPLLETGGPRCKAFVCGPPLFAQRDFGGWKDG